MLAPTRRLTLIDAMRPPAGMVFDEAMAVTFTLDLRALLAAPAAFALAPPSPDAAGDTIGVEPIELLHAVRSHAENITIFSQVGEISLPPSRRVFAFLESSVVPVTAPRHGVVHPKVWVLRYRSEEDPSETCLRVLSGSRNLTFDTSWDTILRLDQSLNGPGVPVVELADMFDSLWDSSHGALDARHAERVRSLGSELRSALFALPDGVDSLTFHVFGFEPSSHPFPETPDRSLVISPFVSDDFFQQLKTPQLGTLVSRPESLDGLDPHSFDRVEEVLVFDDGGEIDLAKGDALAPADPGRPLEGLHAKLFAFELGERAAVYCGSANATGAAFGSNVEVLAELQGPRSSLGIDVLLGSGIDEPGMRSLFLPYRRDSGDGGDVDPDVVGSRADQVRRSLARLDVIAAAVQSNGGWTVSYSSSDAVALREGVVASCWPLTTPGNRRMVEDGKPLDESFATTLEAISGFLAWEVVDKESGQVSSCVVPVHVAGVPEERDAALLRVLIGSAERFFRYLLAMLEDDPLQSSFLDAIEQLHDGPSEARSSEVLPVLEKILKSMRRDPAKLLALDPLVRALAVDDALPAGFDALWSSALQVARQRVVSQ